MSALAMRLSHIRAAPKRPLIEVAAGLMHGLIMIWSRSGHGFLNVVRMGQPTISEIESDV